MHDSINLILLIFVLCLPAILNGLFYSSGFVFNWHLYILQITWHSCKHTPAFHPWFSQNTLLLVHCDTFLEGDHMTPPLGPSQGGTSVLQLSVPVSHILKGLSYYLWWWVPKRVHDALPGSHGSRIISYHWGGRASRAKEGMTSAPGRGWSTYHFFVV